jgi:type II secretory pathway component PulJ
MKRAFTLIEILIASSLGMIIAASAILIAFSFVKSYRVIDAEIDGIDSARMSITRIVSDIRGAGGIGSGSNDEALILDLGGKEIIYDLHDGKVRRSVDGTATYLTEEGRISKVGFSYPREKLARIEVVFGPDGRRALTAEAFLRN